MCVEAAREHGPYELIREPIRLEAEGSRQNLADSGELIDASVTYRV